MVARLADHYCRSPITPRGFGNEKHSALDKACGAALYVTANP